MDVNDAKPLGQVFDLPTTEFIKTKPRQRADDKRSRHDVEIDKHISQVKLRLFRDGPVGQLVCASQRNASNTRYHCLANVMRTAFTISLQRKRGEGA